MRTILLLAVLGAGCATTGKAKFLTDDQLKFDATRYPDDAAVVLFRSDSTELMAGSGSDLTRSTRHEVTAVLGEGGFELAEVKIPLWGSSTLTAFNARVVQPDGTQQLFDGAQLLSDSSGQGERDLNAKFFRFPDVRVGSVLEYQWAIEWPFLVSADEQDTLGPFPVRHYEFELLASQKLVMGTIEFKGGSPIAVRMKGDGRHQVTFQLNDLPPRRKADFSPHWTFTEPRWAWRAVAYRVPGFTYDWLRTWSDVVEGRGVAFFIDGKLEQGLTEPLNVSDCADVKCKVERAMSLLVERTTTRGIRWSREEKLSSALASGKASVVERALLLKFLLAREGLDVWLGYGTGRLSQQVAADFPRLSQFDHLFVHLPAQPGVEQAVTLDASCDYCGYGQLPEHFQRTQVYVFKTKSVLTEAETVGRWITAVEAAPPSTDFLVSHRASLHTDGTVSDLVTVSATGHLAGAHAERQRSSTARKARESEQGVFATVSPLANVESVKWKECNEKACSWETAVSFPREASADGPRWLVPTTVLRPLWEGLFESSTRDLDVHFTDQENVEEIYELTVPEGLELVEVPQPLSVKLDGLEVEVNYKKTPRGVELRRKIAHGVGALGKAGYPELREAVETFRRGRREVLVFAPKTAPAKP
ncbi:MAG: DUF3857 domain-containing protein [Archangium sp.]|nr:DUF3857 domain-containing protein [Archangium sp.]